MALSLNSVTPTGHITMIIYWCVGIFNIRGLTFGHDLSIRHTQSRLNQYGYGPVPAGFDYPTVETVSECQT